MNLTVADMSQLARLNRNLKAEIGVSKRSEDEILNRLGNDLRIELFKGFWKQRWKGKNAAARLLKKLLKSGKGIKVRLNQLVEPWSARIGTTDKKGNPLSMRQKLVAQEMLRRQAGVGVLGVSFLRKRWRYSKEGRYLARNTTKGFGLAATFEKVPGAFTIKGFTPGLATVAGRYGLLSKAMSKVAGKTERYLRRKLGPEFVKQMHAP